MYIASKITFGFLTMVVLMSASFNYAKADKSFTYSPRTTAIFHDTKLTSRRRGYYSSMFGERKINKSSIFTVNNPSRRNGSYQRSHADSSSVLNMSSKAKSRLKEDEINTENGEFEQMSFQELKQHLGPFSLLVANSCEVGVATAFSYLTGGLFGYAIGGAMSIPSLFQPFPTVEKSFLDIIRKKIANCNSSAFAQAKSWGKLSAAFSGFQAAVRVGRGKEDKWNGILGSACTGAFLNRQLGPQAMLQSATTYAGFTYMIDRFAGPGSQNNKVERDFDFKDTPVEVEELGF